MQNQKSIPECSTDLQLVNNFDSHSNVAKSVQSYSLLADLLGQRTDQKTCAWHTTVSWLYFYSGSHLEEVSEEAAYKFTK